MEKIVKQQYLLHMSPQQVEFRPINGWDLLASLGYPSKLKPVLHLGFVTAPMSLIGGQQNFGGCLAISSAGTLYIYFGALAPNGILLATKFTCIQVLHSPILAALLHGTRAWTISQTLWRRTRNRITELLQRAPPIFGWVAITLRIGPHSSFFMLSRLFDLSIAVFSKPIYLLIIPTLMDWVLER